jgi:tetratricopeptide (TPR) repeat protein
MVKPGRYLDLREQMKAGKTVPFEQFLLLDWDGFQTEHYPQAWAMMHFFAHYKKGVLAPYIQKYCHELMRTVREGKRAVKLFQKVVRIPLPELEKRWKEYIKNLKPTTAEDRLAMADRHEWVGDSEKAIAVLDQSLKEDPDDYRALTIKARALAWKDKYKEAWVILARVGKLQPEYADYLRSRAVIFYWEGKYAEAKKAYPKALEKTPLDFWTNLDYLKCLLAAPVPLKDPDTVLELGRMLLDFHQDWEILFLMGRASTAKSDWKGAVKYFEASLKLAPDNDEVKKQLADAKTKAG